MTRLDRLMYQALRHPHLGLLVLLGLLLGAVDTLVLLVGR